MANWKTKSLEEQETERSLRVRKSASCESTTESKTHQNVLRKSSLMFFGALRDAQKYNALIKPLVFVRYKHGKNKNKKKGGNRNTSSSDDDSDNTSDNTSDDDDNDDENEEGGSGAEDDDATLTPFTVASVEPQRRSAGELETRTRETSNVSRLDWRRGKYNDCEYLRELCTSGAVEIARRDHRSGREDNIHRFVRQFRTEQKRRGKCNRKRKALKIRRKKRRIRRPRLPPRDGRQRA